MDGLLTFLIFAALIYLMMRYGCGAHMVHGHHGGCGSGDSDEDKHVDPVCNETVPPDEGYGKMHHGRLYRFCSRQCLEAFDAEPGRFAVEQKEATS
jgi:YHS domain-containing protein